MNINETASKRMMKLFAGNMSAHGTHGAPDPRTTDGKYPIKSSARTIRELVTHELWEEHLNGRKPLGIIPIREDNTCLWGSIDVDEYREDILDIVVRADAANLPLVPCRSKSGGLHLFLFLSEPALAAELRRRLADIARLLRLDACEIFPKQTELQSNATGNWMVMPYYGDTYGGKLREQVGLKKTGSEMEFEEFIRFAESARTTLDQISAMVSSGPKTYSRPLADLFTDGPPCLEVIANSPPLPDGRKRAIFMAGIYLKRREPDNWKTLLEKANVRFCLTPLPASEIVGIQKSLAKRDYQYICKEEPMCNACESAVCRTRRFGIGGRNCDSWPIIASWKKIVSDDPVWIIKIEGAAEELKIVRIDDLTMYRRFTDQCARQLDLFFLPMKQPEWALVLQQAREKLELEEAIIGTTRRDLFHELLEDFLTNRARGVSREDILAGRPWEAEEEGRFYFRLKDLDAFLKREGVRDMSRSECCGWIRAFGGGEKSVTIKRKTTRTWFVPSSAVNRAPELAPPPAPPKKI
jgi:hypothetical protein